MAESIIIVVFDSNYASTIAKKCLSISQQVEHDKFIKKHEDEAEARELESLESNEEDDDDDEEFDLEEEMFGNHDRRNEGINLLDESMDVVLSEPSDRVLRALAAPEGHPKKLSFEKVKRGFNRFLGSLKRQGKGDLSRQKSWVR